MLTYSFGLTEEAGAIEAAMRQVMALCLFVTPNRQFKCGIRFVVLPVRDNAVNDLGGINAIAFLIGPRIAAGAHDSSGIAYLGTHIVTHQPQRFWCRIDFIGSGRADRESDEVMLAQFG